MCSREMFSKGAGRTDSFGARLAKEKKGRDGRLGERWMARARSTAWYHAPNQAQGSALSDITCPCGSLLELLSCPERRPTQAPALFKAVTRNE